MLLFTRNIKTSKVVLTKTVDIDGRCKQGFRHLDNTVVNKCPVCVRHCCYTNKFPWIPCVDTCTVRVKTSLTAEIFQRLWLYFSNKRIFDFVVVYFDFTFNLFVSISRLFIWRGKKCWMWHCCLRVDFVQFSMILLEFFLNGPELPCVLFPILYLKLD